MTSPLQTERKTRGDAMTLAEHASVLEVWLCQENLTYAQAAERLRAEHGIEASIKQLHRWYQRHQKEQLRQTVLRNVTNGAEAVRQIKRQAESHGVPQLDELMAWVRVMVANLATRPDAEANVDGLTKLIYPALEWARLQAKRDELALAHQKFATALKSKIEQGLDELAAAFKAHPEAMDLYRQARELIARETST